MTDPQPGTSPDNKNPLLRLLLTVFNAIFYRVTLRREALRRWRDYWRFRSGFVGYKTFLYPDHLPDARSFLFAAGSGMNRMFVQIILMLTLGLRRRGYRACALTWRGNSDNNRLLKLFRVKSIILDDELQKSAPPLPTEILAAWEAAGDLAAIKAIAFERLPLGEIAISTWLRYNLTGSADITAPPVRAGIWKWIETVWKSYCLCQRLMRTENIELLLFTETFMEEHAGFYYAALNAQKNVIRFMPTVRDDALIVQRRDWKTERLHQGAMAEPTWAEVKAIPTMTLVERQVRANFDARYGGRWHRSARNQAGAQKISDKGLRAKLGLAPSRKVAIIFSHILYDNIFFFGTDLYQDYTEWLLETVRIAIANDKLDWFIKVHPSNVWRGEVKVGAQFLSQEEALIHKRFGALPAHVRIISSDSKVSPISWMELCDFGVTVRGTVGLELPILGKCVITAGTGRYEGAGFTIDPANQAEYEETLMALPDIKPPVNARQLALRYAFGVFILKPFQLTSTRPILATGRREVKASDDLVYIPVQGGGHMADIDQFTEFALDRSRIELIKDWRELQNESTGSA